MAEMKLKSWFLMHEFDWPKQIDKFYMQYFMYFSHSDINFGTGGGGGTVFPLRPGYRASPVRDRIHPGRSSPGNRTPERLLDISRM